MMDLYLHMLLALILIGGLIYLLGMFAKKKQAKGSLMKIIGYQSLGPKKGMAMVKVGREVLLLGVTANDVKLLKTINRVEEETELPQSFEKVVAAVAADASQTFDAFSAEVEAARQQPPERLRRVIVADTNDKLKKLRAIKDALVCN